MEELLRLVYTDIQKAANNDPTGALIILALVLAAGGLTFYAGRELLRIGLRRFDVWISSDKLDVMLSQKELELQAAVDARAQLLVKLDDLEIRLRQERADCNAKIDDMEREVHELRMEALDLKGENVELKAEKAKALVLAHEMRGRRHFPGGTSVPSDTGDRRRTTDPQNDDGQTEEEG